MGTYVTLSEATDKSENPHSTRLAHPFFLIAVPE